MLNDPRGRIVQPSALHPSPGFHRRDLFPVDLARCSGEESRELASGGVVEFVVTTPEVRSQVRLSLIFVPSTYPGGLVPGLGVIDYFWPTPKPVPFASYFGATALWLAKRDESCNGSGENVPVENLVGDVWAPRPLPDPGCLGFTASAETCNDELWGRFTVDASLIVGFAGKWVLRASAVDYQGVSEQEWNRVVGRFAIRVIKSANLAGGNQPE